MISDVYLYSVSCIKKSIILLYSEWVNLYSFQTQLAIYSSAQTSVLIRPIKAQSW